MFNFKSIVCWNHKYSDVKIISEKSLFEKIKNGVIEYSYSIEYYRYKFCTNCNKEMKEKIGEEFKVVSMEEYLLIEDLEKEFSTKYRNIIVPKTPVQRKKNIKEENAED